MAGGTEIDTGAVSRAGVGYCDVSTHLAGAGAALNATNAPPSAFGRAYQDRGDAVRAAVAELTGAVDAWRDGSKAVGAGLTASSAAHVGSDTSGATAVRSAGRG